MSVGEWHEWRCPGCPDWGCGSLDPTSVEDGKRLHCATAHEGLTFREAIQEQAKRSSLAKPAYEQVTDGDL